MPRLLLLIIVFFSLAINCYSQSTKATNLKNIDMATEYMTNGEFNKADSLFRLVLQNMKVLPSNIAFYFGKNSYYLGKYKQSIDWTTKYLALKGTKGRFYQEANTILDKAKNGLNAQAEADAKVVREKINQTRFDCHENSFVKCPVCDGSGVVIFKGAFENVYKVCPYSGQDGYLTCEEYNLYLLGELEPDLND